MCVHYLEITILTPVINIGVLASIIFQVHIYTRPMPARLRIILLFLLFILSFEECQVCVHYLEITILTLAINIGVLEMLK